MIFYNIWEGFMDFVWIALGFALFTGSMFYTFGWLGGLLG